MVKFEFISHDSFPEDEYVKEIVYLCLEGKYRVAYVRKKAQNGGMFWSIPSVSATRQGKKEYYPGFMQDSNFLEKDIKDFLDKRKWESNRPAISMIQSVHQPQSMDEVTDNDHVPF